MSRFVLDASVSAAWFLPHEKEAHALQVRQRLAQGDQAVVPNLWSIEMANVLARAVRKGALTSQEGEHALGQLEILLIPIPHRIEVQSVGAPVWQAYGAALKYELTAYDGVYLSLALYEGLPLATLDESLSAAAAKAGVKLV